MEALKTFEQKIAHAIDKIKALKEENNNLMKEIADLENSLRLKDQEMERLVAERGSIRDQIEDLLKELETIELK
ncbi:MAG TPA: cell division protein ZapB [Dissulfurispiraceae bacterium]|nr:cell division protein ZapB [Dissulfurispiraceae bacterium]